ncbi:uncharacterized protein BO96DRAFT_368128 [Aspergillus niger CBS 101883]|uniref:Contig An18c0030, genomic contig n=2 Tax=Aspergillus niger TaxID=5061 RepID=A2R9Z9_ASPNC
MTRNLKVPYKSLQLGIMVDEICYFAHAGRRGRVKDVGERRNSKEDTGSVIAVIFRKDQMPAKMALNTNCYCNNPSYRTGLMKASQEGYSRQWQFRLPSLSSFRGILGTHALLKSQIGYHSLSASIDVSSVVEVAKSRNSKILPPRRSSIVLGILEKAIESSSTTTKRQLYTGIKAVNSMC